MNNETVEGSRSKPRSIRETLLIAWQGLFALILGLFVLTNALSTRQLSAAGAPVLLFWSMIGAGILLTLAHLPAVFVRLPKGGGKVAYLATGGFFVLWIVTLMQVQTAWQKTPRGAAEAQAAEAARQADAADEQHRQATEAALAEAGAAQEQLQEKTKQLESCFTTFGHRLPALEKAVKESLHNPHAFEHVETVAIVPDSERNNVAMTFRAENGFGALRTFVVKASVYPEDCDIAGIGEPELL